VDLKNKIKEETMPLILKEGLIKKGRSNKGKYFYYE
jgi:hypothetical protein